MIIDYIFFFSNYNLKQFFYKFEFPSLRWVIHTHHENVGNEMTQKHILIPVLIFY